LGIGLGKVEMRSVGVLHYVSECRVTVYCAFTGVSLSLLTVALLIDRHAEHIQFVPAGTENMYILHLQAQRTERAHFLLKHHLYPLFHYFTYISTKNRQLTVKYIMKCGSLGGVHTIVW
jgi:hypothetical protein